MRALLRPAAVAVLALAAAAPAHGWPPNDGTYRGRCVLVAANEGHQVATSPNWYTGWLSGAVTAYAPTLGHNPVDVTSLSCEVRVNGVPAASIPPASGTGAATTNGPVVFFALDTDSVQVCALVDTLDAHGHPRSFADCGPVRRALLPPQPVVDSLYDACMAATADPSICALITNSRARLIFGTSP